MTLFKEEGYRHHVLFYNDATIPTQFKTLKKMTKNNQQNKNMYKTGQATSIQIKQSSVSLKFHFTITEKNLSACTFVFVGCTVF